jgi:FHS family L-fucose permease-like MFS transporter
MQYAFLVSMACFVYISFYFYGEMKRQAKIKENKEKNVGVA